MNLAVLGNGGVGKTTAVALLARAFAERGRMVLAVDLDVNPGLAVSLGIPPDDTPLPEEAVEECEDAPYGWTLASHLTAAEAVRRYGTPAGPRLVYLGFGNIGHAVHPLRRYITAVRHVAERFDDPGWVVISDLGAGPTPAFEGHAREVSKALVLAEPNPASLVAARRIIGILDHDGTPAGLVMNKVDQGFDAAGVRPEPLGCIPLDPDLRALERSSSLAAIGARSDALEAIRSLAARLETTAGM